MLVARRHPTMILLRDGSVDVAMAAVGAARRTENGAPNRRRGASGWMPLRGQPGGN
jgi:hypothetical protein